MTIEKMLAEVLREPALGEKEDEGCLQQGHLTGRLVRLKPSRLKSSL